MKIAAVIAEYNPFHLGHAWQLQEIKHTYGADICVVIMSGNYVQRGAPAIVDKFTRAKWTLQHGADIVFELPCIFATAGAEQFAYGACMLLDKLGFIDMLCFGSEIEDSDFIKRIADIFIELPPSYEDHVKKLLRQGKSYAAAREEALYPLLAKEFDFQKYKDRLKIEKKETAQEIFHTIISAPNTILGIEYCKALKKRNSLIQPVPLLRTGSHHSTFLPEQKNPVEAETDRDMIYDSPSVSASAIRTHLLDPSFCPPASFDRLSSFIPQAVLADLPLLALMHENDFSSYLYYALLGKNADELERYYEISPDLAHRIIRCFPQFQDFSSFAELLKTKNYAHARIKRALLHILLSIQKEDPFQECCFLRLLGLKKESSCLLRNIEEQTGLTIITKASSASKKLYSMHDKTIFDKDISASQLYGFLFHKKGNAKPYRELATSPVIL